jgi:hypothetical protein
VNIMITEDKVANRPSRVFLRNIILRRILETYDTVGVICYARFTRRHFRD